MPRLRCFAPFPLLALIAGVPAGAATLELFDPADRYQRPASPVVAFNPDADNFLVVSDDAGQALSRRTGLRGDGSGPWTLPQRPLAENIWGLDYLAYSRDSKSYVGVAGDSYFRLAKSGRVVRQGRFRSTFVASVLAMTTVPGSRKWFAWLQECKYGCWLYGRYLWPRGTESGDVLLGDLPLEDEYSDDFRRWQIGYDPGDKTFLLLWEDGRDGRDYYEPGLSIGGQRFGRDGSLVGKSIQITRHAKEAWQPHMVYQPERREFLVVYRKGKRLTGRFVRAGKRSPEFRLRGSRHAMVPSVAYSARRNRYLVTWVRQGEDSGIYGLWLQADGRPVGKSFVVNDPHGNQWVEKPGYSACNDTGACLVAWINDGDLSIRGKYLRVP